MSADLGEERGRGVLDGAFQLLRALPDADRAHQFSDLARITGIARSSVYRLMAQLQAVGAVERIAEGYYVPTQLLSDIARRTDPAATLRTKALSVMHALRNQTGATVSLVVPGGSGPVALEVLPGREALPTPIYPGIAMPRNSAAALVFDSRPAPERADPVAGWARDDASVYSGLTCHASAIRVGGRIEAALQVSTPSRRPSSQFAQLLTYSTNRIISQ
jgi:DNA-binding IclR family transcriptional regulator